MDDIKAALSSLIKTLEQTIKSQTSVLEQVSSLMTDCLIAGGKILLCGNGGSAADSQHIAAEFVNRFKIERNPLPAVALTTDTSILTAIANDYSFEEIFSKQVQALGKKGDVLIGISTSGTSKNVLKALEIGKKIGLNTVGFCGKNHKKMSKLCDFVITVESHETPRIQETHIFLGHVLCELVERSLFKK